jgi:hypothetical protein
MQLKFSWYRALALTVPLASGFALGTAGCAEEDPSCVVGSFACQCFPGNVCLAGLTCLSGICLQIGGEEETTGDPGDGDGDGDTGPGDGDGDGDNGDGDGDNGDGDGDGDTGPGDGDGDTGGDPCGAGAPEVLFTQIEIGEGAGFGSNTFLDYDNAVIQVADDFTIPQSDSCWCITEIVAKGFYRDLILPANTPNVFVEIYNDGNTVPTGTPIFNDTLVPDDNEGIFTLALPDAVISAGTYWLSVHAEMEFAETNWNWFLGSSADGDPMASRDTDGLAFDGNCTVWTPTSVCLGEPLPDPWEFVLQFEITGVIGGDACN